MGRAAATFKQSDLTRALKGAKAAGVAVARVEVGTDGKIIIVVGEPAPGDAPNELDRELKEFEGKHAR